MCQQITIRNAKRQEQIRAAKGGRYKVNVPTPGESLGGAKVRRAAVGMTA
jgi:hypothetical protein